MRETEPTLLRAGTDEQTNTSLKMTATTTLIATT